MAPRRKQPAGPTPVEAIVHGDKRTNIPTADAQEFAPDDVSPPVLRYPRDPSLDPQLVWKGKDAQDGEDLEVPAPPIYIQEKIDPRVLVENLRSTARANEPEPELTLFDTFDGLDELAMVDFYRHQSNWSNRMILGDSLQVMGSLAEREALRGKVQMIYLDPPYGIKFGSNWQLSARKRDVKDGKLEDVSFEVEQIKAFRDTWELGIHSYLSYLRDRLQVARDLVTESGSIFVQIGDENVHLVRSLLDEVFGRENFVSQISFATTSGFAQADGLGRAGDFLVWYGRDSRQTRSNQMWQLAGDRQGYRWLIAADGSYRGLTSAEVAGEPTPTGSRRYAPGDLQSQGAATEPQPFVFNHRSYSPGQSSHWKANYPAGMQRLAWAGRIHEAKNSIRYRRFADDFPLQARTNFWTDTATGNFTDDKVYVVQTNTKVIERCMLMCTDPGDLVLDATCGSGTTAYVAEQWGRRWITIDTSRVALALARQRVMGAKFPYYLLADSPEGQRKEAELTATLPSSEPTRGDIRRGFVYERVQHITLKSIANNPDIKEGMSREEIDEAIARHADFELLYDKPYEDRKTVRVAGPFTVESLSPHRSLAFAGQAPDPDTVTVAGAPDPLAEGAGFEAMILENLSRAGIQNGRRNERLTFAAVETYPGLFVQAIGERDTDPDAVDGTPQRVAIAIGPQYGTVDGKFIKRAGSEAIAAGVDLLAVLAFAFDPRALTADDDVVATDEGFPVERNLGRMPALLVRMNNDLAMGDELKKTGSGNLFTVFGEPDIDLRVEGEGADRTVTVELHGVDVYDPSTGEVRSRDTDHIAMWMIDTDYDEESFFVRHCYFTGGNDPYARLKRALKADIDEDAWASIYRTVSRPFPAPETGKIAVKVINDYGDEVMQVFDV